MNKRKLLVWIPVLALLLNGVGYLILTRGRTTTSPSPAKNAASLAPTGPAPSNGTLGTLDRVPPGTEEEEKKNAGMARRAAGLAALEAGNYDNALINFTEARSLLGDKANVADLLRVTQDLRKGGKTAARPNDASVGREPAPTRTKTRSAGERRVAIRDEPAAPEAPAVQAAPPSGLLIVTTTPRGLLVRVDDTPIDLTPMRTKVRPGSHRVALLDGDRKVYETTVDVKEGATATLLKDLTPEPPPEAPRAATSVAPTSAAAPAMVAPTEPPRPTTTAALTTTPPPPSGALSPPVAAPAGTSAGTGTLDVTSPGLYGVVWINGRPRGYPPLVIRDLPAGKTKVEVRVNGIQKRSATIVVKPGLTTSVNLRSSETGL